MSRYTVEGDVFLWTLIFPISGLFLEFHTQNLHHLERMSLAHSCPRIHSRLYLRDKTDENSKTFLTYIVKEEGLYFKEIQISITILI